MNGELEIRRIEVDDDGQQLNIKVEVHNASDRTLYFYRDVRGVKYDDASKTLRLLLTDRHVVEGPVRFIAAKPPLVAVAPGESETVSFRVARMITQLGPEQAGRPGPTLKQTPIHEAEVVEVEVSWSDKPFYPEPKTKRTPVEQLRRWERGVLEARIDRRGGRPTPSPDKGSKRPRRRRDRR